ncbi:DUF4233 domain-containing protein [Rhodococcus sp. NPDC049939]|uniref:DUF4233 domain-containing protein n=1 Tax=Rhodococcus sp. NPDC049939 TaxID=3155511 RepID=UPI0033CBB198
MSESNSSASEPEFAPPTSDPWKGFRGVVAGSLILEAIVVLLALPVVATVGGGLTWLSGTYLVGLSILMILGAGLQGRPWAMTYNLLLQVALILGFFVHESIGIVGLVFAILWGYILYFRKKVRQRMEQGLLPGQRE